MKNPGIPEKKSKLLGKVCEKETLQARKAAEQQRKLVLVAPQGGALDQIKIMNIKRQINQKFIETGEKLPVLALITYSREKGNLILQTTEHFSAKFLQQNEDVWRPFFSFSRAQTIENWPQIVAHGVPIEPFSGPTGQLLMKEEIQDSNQVEVKGLPRWLSPRSKRELPGSVLASIVFAVKDEEKEKEILSWGSICLGGSRLKVVKYHNFTATMQCSSCQQFGHGAVNCSKKACKFCGNSHLSKDHCCSLCKTTGKPCDHTALKCANCGGKHAATSKDCPTYLAVATRRIQQPQTPVTQQRVPSPLPSQASNTPTPNAHS